MDQQMHGVLSILQGAGNHTDRQGMSQAVAELNKQSTSPEFNLCLVRIALARGAVDDAQRQTAALRLRGNIARHGMKILPNVEALKGQLTEAFGDTNKGIAGAVASVVSEIGSRGGWDTLVLDLWPKFCGSQDPTFRLGALTCIERMCEDCGVSLEKVMPGSDQPQVVRFVPTLLETTSSVTNIKEMTKLANVALQLLSTQTYNESPIYKAFQESLGPYLQVLDKCFGVAMEHAGRNETRRDAVELIKMVFGSYTQCLYYYDLIKQANQLGPIFNRAFGGMNMPNDEVALAACEFWRAIAEHMAAPADIRNMGQMPNLVQALVEKTVYSEDEIAELEDMESQQMRAGRKPGDDDEGEVEQWTIRKCAGLALDKLSTTECGMLLTPPNMPEGWLLNEVLLPRIKSADWKISESALMCLGAIQIGCGDMVMNALPSLPQAVLSLITQSTHKFHKAMAVWVIGRYAMYIQNDFQQTLEMLLAEMRSPSKQVQRCSVSSLADLLEADGARTPSLLQSDPKYMEHILGTVSSCLTPGAASHQTLVILFEVLGILCKLVPQQMQTAEIQQHVWMPFLKHYFFALPSDDAVLMVYSLPAVNSALYYIGRSFEPLKGQLAEKLTTVVGELVLQQMQYVHNQREKAPDTSNAAFAYEAFKRLPQEFRDDAAALLGTKMQGQDKSMLELSLMIILTPELEMDDMTVLQALGLLGDLLRVCPRALLEHLLVPARLELLTKMMCDEQGRMLDNPMANDIAWFFGELVHAAGAEGAQGVDALVQTLAGRLVPGLINEDKLIFDANTLQNIALAVGKMANHAPQVLAPQLHTFFEPLVYHLSMVTEAIGEGQENDVQEKAEGMMGVVRLLEKEFSVMQDKKNVVALSKALVNCHCRNVPEIKQAYTQIVSAIKQSWGANWAAVSNEARFPPEFIQMNF